MKSLIFLTVLLLFAFPSFAQPSNNTCSGATTLPQNGTCLNGTTSGAGDTFPGNIGCQTSNPPEVWYTLTATGTQLNIQLTNITQSGSADIHLVQASAPCSGLILAGASCGASPANVNFTTTPGQLYYVMISTNGTTGTFQLCATSSTPPPSPGQNCTNAAPLCGNSSFSQGVFSGIGIAENISTNTCFGGNERQSKWYTFTAGTTGTFQFVVTPTVSTNDYDWALWNTTAGCYTSGTTMGSAIRCNWSGCPGSTGIHPTPSSVPGANNSNGGGPSGCGGTYSAFNTSPPTLTAGETYTILVDNFGASGNGFNMNFGGTVHMGPNAEFTATLGGDCRTVTLNRTPYYTGGNMTYSWNFGDGTSSAAGNPGSYTYAFEGNYFIGLTVTDANGCTDSYSVQINGCIVLPVELSEFKGYKNETDNFLYWTTQSERDNSHFIMEHSLNGIEWQVIGKVQGSGTTSSKNSYLYTHESVPTEINYYRLSQTDFDGTSKTYDPILIDNRNNVFLVKTFNTVGQEVPDTYKGLVIEYFSDGSTIKRIR